MHFIHQNHPEPNPKKDQAYFGILWLRILTGIANPNERICHISKNTIIVRTGEYTFYKKSFIRI
jgi:hypothetical protein